MNNLHGLIACFTGAIYSLSIVRVAKLASMFFGNFFACSVLPAVVVRRRIGLNRSRRVSLLAAARRFPSGL